jgi:hypothetical protein
MRAQNGIAPRFEFGLGLSYTTFAYANLVVARLARDPTSAYGAYEDAWDAGDASPYEQGMSAAPWLHAPAYTVSFDLSNNGTRAGTEVAQVYVAFPLLEGEPPAVLRGFADVELQQGESRRVVVTLSRYALSVWDTNAMGWRRTVGEVGILVGASSRDVRLRGTLPAYDVE